MWQVRTALRASRGSTARRTIASGFVLSGTGDCTAARDTKSAGW